MLHGFSRRVLRAHPLGVVASESVMDLRFAFVHGRREVKLLVSCGAEQTLDECWMGLGRTIDSPRGGKVFVGFASCGID